MPAKMMVSGPSWGLGLGIPSFSSPVGSCMLYRHFMYISLEFYMLLDP